MVRGVRREVITPTAEVSVPVWRWRLWGHRLLGTDHQALLRQRGEDTVRASAIGQGFYLLGDPVCVETVEDRKVHLLFEVMDYRDHALDDADGHAGDASDWGYEPEADGSV